MYLFSLRISCDAVLGDSTQSSAGGAQQPCCMTRAQANQNLGEDVGQPCLKVWGVLGVSWDHRSLCQVAFHLYGGKSI